MCVYVCMHVCVCVYVCMYVCMYVCVRVYVCMYACVRVYVNRTYVEILYSTPFLDKPNSGGEKARKRELLVGVKGLDLNPKP